ncbi:hypothetical protein ACQKNQ_12240 [Staphylococcus pasteuri]|uniref:hypothetical protein n=1 Tax=Staphylococcus pasteuri TaxID=45972 RepID=UPI003D00EBFC
MKNINLRKNANYISFDNLNCYKLSGDDCEEILDFNLTKSVEFADTMTANYHFALNNDGNIIAEVILFKLENEFLLFSDCNIEEIINNTEGIQIDNQENLTIIQIEGANSLNIIKNIETDENVDSIEFKEVITGNFNEKRIYISRFGFTGEMGYQIILPKNEKSEFIKRYMSSIENISRENYIYTLFEVGHPIKEIYNTQKFNLNELGYIWNIDFTKEKFRGKEELLSQLHKLKRHVIGFKTKDKIDVMEKIYFDNLLIGEVVTIYYDSDQKQYKGLIMLDNQFAHSNISFVSENSNNIKTISSPYTIPESWKNNEF